MVIFHRYVSLPEGINIFFKDKISHLATQSEQTTRARLGILMLGMTKPTDTSQDLEKHNIQCSQCYPKNLWPEYPVLYIL